MYRAVVDDREFPANLKWNAPCMRAGPDCHLVHYLLRGGEPWNVVVTFHTTCADDDLVVLSYSERTAQDRLGLFCEQRL